MAAVRVMQVAIHQVVHMIAMRDRLVTATGAMHMTGFVAAARRGAAGGILGADFDDVFFVVIAFRMHQVPIVEVIDVPVMFHRDAFVSFGVAHNFDVLRLRKRPPATGIRQTKIVRAGRATVKINALG